MTPKLYKSYAWLRTRFVVQQKSIEAMAAEAGVSEMTIRRALEEKKFIRKQ